MKIDPNTGERLSNAVAKRKKSREVRKKKQMKLAKKSNDWAKVEKLEREMLLAKHVKVVTKPKAPQPRSFL